MSAPSTQPSIEDWPGNTPPVAVVTGAGQGIGHAIAHRLAEAGLRIVVNDLMAESAERVREEITSAGGHATVHVGDISDAAEVARLSEVVASWAGRVDVLVNNAGIGDAVLPTERQDIAAWQQVVDVLLRGPYLCSRQLGADFMLPAGFGRIVNIASIAGLVGLPMRSSYGPAKAGIVMLTKTLGAEWARYGIRVNAVAPGYVATSLVNALAEEGKLDPSALRRRIPMGELGTPADIADAVAFLVSRQARYVTGITLPVDGGWTAFGAAGDAFPLD